MACIQSLSHSFTVSTKASELCLHKTKYRHTRHLNQWILPLCWCLHKSKSLHYGIKLLVTQKVMSNCIPGLVNTSTWAMCVQLWWISQSGNPSLKEAAYYRQPTSWWQSTEKATTACSYNQWVNHMSAPDMNISYSSVQTNTLHQCK